MNDEEREEIEKCVQDLAGINRFLSTHSIIFKKKLEQQHIDAIQDKIIAVQRKLREMKKG